MTTLFPASLHLNLCYPIQYRVPLLTNYTLCELLEVTLLFEFEQLSSWTPTPSS